MRAPISIPSVSDPEVDRAIAKLVQRIEQLEASPLITAQIIKFTPVASTSVRVPHALGKRYTHVLALENVDFSVDTTKSRKDKEVWITASNYGSATTVYGLVF